MASPAWNSKFPINVFINIQEKNLPRPFGATTKCFHFTSKIRPGAGLPRPQGVPPDQKYCGWSTPPMGGSNHPSLVKIQDMALRHMSVSCVLTIVKRIMENIYLWVPIPTKTSCMHSLLLIIYFWFSKLDETNGRKIGVSNLPINLILANAEVQISCEWVNLVHIVISKLKI